jgi:hypothetical protein|tara:strand:+ start:94 stop:1815 length:1722 start_codon:yes stop_codon:yes gene_type:complete
MSKVIAAYGGGFKPPTKGHFEVVIKALNDFPEIDEFIIYVGSGVRNGISQIESILIWDIYSTYLPMKVKIEPSKAPIGDIIRLGKNNPEDTVYFIIGGREGNKDDEEDIQSRTKNIELVYPNMKVKPIITQDVEMSGTNARKASTQSEEELEKFLPNELNSKEKLEVFNIIRPVIKEQLNENATYTKKINLINKLATLTQHMIDTGMNIEPLPKLEFIDGDSENASEFLGKTAYYDPNTQTIVLYTEGRHPKDITRSYAHEMIHHIQNLEGRLGNITTTNTHEDDNLNDIEAEANLKGTMTFRNWTDSLNEAIVGDKIECDNCDWSWDIKDGGDDLFVCHKCGYDNEPINEDKDPCWDTYKIGNPKTKISSKTGKRVNNCVPKNENKDYFGLNKILKELAGETSLPEEEVVSLPPMEYKIYSDMDGVLTDFDESFKKYSKGIPPREYEKTHGRDGFWKLIDGEGKVGFWVGMPWMSDGKQYWDYIKNYDVELLSSPSRSETSRLGKRLWVRNNMPGIKLTLAQSFNKKNYAEPNHILIDDRKSNIEQWVKAGGVGILHTSAADTINQLKSLGL